MAIYTVGRRRVIIALLLTSALLLTLDLRGNPGIDRVRDGFTRVMEPIESATGVITTPIERAWNGVVNYDDLELENQALQDQLDRLIGTQASAEASVIESQELQALYNLPSLAGIETEVAQVVGYAANNLDQVVEINKGRRSGISVGMPVVNQAGLIGKVTKVTDNTARVMLVTDTRYTVGVKITSAVRDDDETVVTTPSGLAPDEIADAATTTTPSTTLPDGESANPTTTLPQGLPIPESTLPGASPLPDFDDFPRDESGNPIIFTNPENGEPLSAAEIEELVELATAAATTTTTTLPEVGVEKEFGALEGRGRLLFPQIRFLQDNPSLAVLQEGDLVETAGGLESLAPTGIPVGRVANRADRPGSGGPLLDVELNADLSRLNFVRVVLYKPLSEVEQ
jgi:rod shape-determining protein MreC